MSLTVQVTLLVRQLGSATVDDLAPLLPGFSRKQIIKALSNATHDRGWLTCTGHGPRKGKRGRGSFPATYTAVEGIGDIPKKRDYARKPKAPATKVIRLRRWQVPSVFHLGAMQ